MAWGMREYPHGPPPRQGECLCSGIKCGYIEVPSRILRLNLRSQSAVVKALREFGAVVRNSLGGVLPGHWILHCQYKAFTVEKMLEKDSEL